MSLEEALALVVLYGEAQGPKYLPGVRAAPSRCGRNERYSRPCGSRVRVFCAAGHHSGAARTDVTGPEGAPGRSRPEAAPPFRGEFPRRSRSHRTLATSQRAAACDDVASWAILSSYYIAWWNLENLFDEENSPLRTEQLQRAIGKDIVGWTPVARPQDLATGRLVTPA